MLALCMGRCTVSGSLGFLCNWISSLVLFFNAKFYSSHSNNERIGGTTCLMLGFLSISAEIDDIMISFVSKHKNDFRSVSTIQKEKNKKNCFELCRLY